MSSRIRGCFRGTTDHWKHHQVSERGAGASVLPSHLPSIPAPGCTQQSMLCLWAGDISFLTQLRTIITMQSSLPHTKACLGTSDLQAKISNAVPEAGSHPSLALGEAREWIHHKPECQSWPGELWVVSEGMTHLVMLMRCS